MTSPAGVPGTAGQAIGSYLAEIACRLTGPARARRDILAELRAGLDLDWDDPATRGVTLAQVLGLLERVEAFTASHAGGQAAASAACSQARATPAICGGPSAGGADSSSTVSPASP